MNGHVHGVNIAVRDLAAATARYEAIFGVPARAIDARFFAMPDIAGNELIVNGFSIKLLAATSDRSAVAGFIAKNGEGMMVLTMEVADYDAAAGRVVADGARLAFDQPVTGPAGTVNFIHPKTAHGVQIEVIAPSPAFAARNDAP